MRLQRALTVASRKERQKFSAQEAARVAGEVFDEAAYDAQVAAEERQNGDDEADDLYEVRCAAKDCAS